MAVYRRKEDNPQGYYYTDFSFNGKRVRKCTHTTNKRAAETIEADMMTNMAKGTYLDIKDQSRIKFEEFADRYIEDHSKVNNKSWKEDMLKLKVLKKEFGNKWLDEITTSNVVRFKAKLVATKKSNGQAISAATVNHKLTLLKSIFNKAIAWGVFFKQNPCVSVPLLKTHNVRERFLEKEEINNLLKQCAGELFLAVTFALLTGMRKGEIEGLRWIDINFKRNLIFVRRSGPRTYSPKSGKNRAFPMTPSINKILLECKEIKYKKTSKLLKRKEEGYVFASTYREAYEAAVKRANLNPTGTDRLDKVVFHTLRHTFASYLAIGGIDLFRISKLLGNSLQMVQDRYAHLQPNHFQGAIDIIDTYMARDDSKSKLLTSQPIETMIG